MCRWSGCDYCLALRQLWWWHSVLWAPLAWAHSKHNQAAHTHSPCLRAVHTCGLDSSGAHTCCALPNIHQWWPSKSHLLHLKHVSIPLVLFKVKLQPALMCAAAVSQISPVCSKYLFASLCQAFRAAVRWIVSGQSGSTHVCTHHSFLHCRASCLDCVNPLSSKYFYTPDNVNGALRNAHTCTHCPSLPLLQLEPSQRFCLQLWGFEVEGERRGWRKSEKKRKSRLEKTHQRVCDILVTFYRNCCSTPSHTC